MRARILLLLVALGGCGYWKAPVRGDTAPATWGDVGPDAPGGATPANPPVSAPVMKVNAASDAEERLRNLEGLYRRGVIDAAEYHRRREQLLQAAFD